MAENNTVVSLAGRVGPERENAPLTVQVMAVDGAEGYTLYIDHEEGDQELVAELYLTPWQAKKLARLLADLR